MEYTDESQSVEVIQTFESPVGDDVRIALFVAGQEPFPVRLQVTDSEGSEAEAWLTPDMADYIASRMVGVAERARREHIHPSKSPTACVVCGKER